jgi:hypothetical protein
MEHYYRAKEQGGGVLLVTGHLWSFELALAALAKDLGPLSVIVKHFPAGVDRFINSIRACAGTRVIRARGTTTRILQSLKRNEVVLAVLDQKARRTKGVFVDFFGTPARTMAGAAMIAIRSEAEVLGASSWRESDGTHVISIGTPFPHEPAESLTAAIQRGTQHYTHFIEQAIRAHPEQWLWAQTRLKTRPPGSVKEDGECVMQRPHGNSRCANRDVGSDMGNQTSSTTRVAVVALVLWVAFGQAPLLVMAEETTTAPCDSSNLCQGPTNEPPPHDEIVSGVKGRSVASTIKLVGATVLDDAAYIVTAPLRMDLESGLITAAVAGAIGGLMVVDSDIQKFMQRNQSTSGNNAANVVKQLATAVAPVNVGLAGLGYVFRQHDGGSKLFQTSLVALEAQGLAGGLTQLAKFAVGRNRPSKDPQGNSYDPFSTFGQSFPSGHATQLFAFAAVFSEEFAQPVPIFLYALATAVGLERLYSNEHFSSDVFAGAVLGYIIGKTLVHRHTSDRGLSIVPLDIAGAGIAVKYRF